MSITDEDRGRVNGLLYQNGIALHADVVSQLAAMIATEREKARAPFLAVMTYYETQARKLAQEALDRGRPTVVLDFDAMRTVADRIRRAAEDS